MWCTCTKYHMRQAQLVEVVFAPITCMQQCSHVGVEAQYATLKMCPKYATWIWCGKMGLMGLQILCHSFSPSKLHFIPSLWSACLYPRSWWSCLAFGIWCYDVFAQNVMHIHQEDPHEARHPEVALSPYISLSLYLSIYLSLYLSLQWLLY